MKQSIVTVSIAGVFRLCALTILLAPLLVCEVSAQTAKSQSMLSLATVTQWNDSLQSLRAPTLIAKQYASWKKHYEKTLAEYRRDSTSASYERRSQLCAQEFAELEPLAFTAHFLAGVDSVLHLAKKADAKRYAPLTLSRAKMYRSKSDSALAVNRNNLKYASLERSRAEYEARHALTIAQQIRPLAQQRNRCEQTILHTEKQLQQLGKALEIQLRFDEGSDTAIAELSQALTMLRVERQEALERIDHIEDSFKDVFAEIGVYPPQDGDVETYVTALSDEFRQLVRELDDSKRELRQCRQRVSELTHAKETAETILSSKEAKERRFQQTRSLFNPEEAIVLYNGSQDIVIRLRGITFPSGVALLSSKDDSLLAKVTQALALYPNAHIIIEGHTDNTGGAKLNVRLSEKRANAVMEHLIQASGRPPEDFEAIGYGAEKPVANNQTAHGRKENRRIDIVIVR